MMITYTYSEKENFPEENLCDLYFLADMFGFEDLKQLSIQLIRSKLCNNFKHSPTTISNIPNIFEFAIDIQHSSLINECFKYIFTQFLLVIFFFFFWFDKQFFSFNFFFF